MGTHWELEGNIKETCWEQRKNEENLPRPPQEKKKKARQGEIWRVCFETKLIFARKKHSVSPFGDFSPQKENTGEH
jgi:hypothetical protein